MQNLGDIVRRYNWPGLRRMWENKENLLSLAMNYKKKHGRRAFLKRLLFALRRENFHSNYSGLRHNFSNSLDSLFELNPRVILVGKDFSSPSHIYRTRNFSNAFWELGVPTDIVTIEQIVSMSVLPRNTELVIFSKTALNVATLPWVEKARRDKVNIVYDNDTLAFDESVYNLKNLYGLTRVDGEDEDCLNNASATLQEQQIKQRGLVITTTPEMGNTFRKLGLDAFTIPNVLPRWMERQALQINADRLEKVIARETNGIRIVYASGTPTYGAGFKSCVPGIISFLNHSKDSTLTILGSPPSELNDFPHMIRNQIFFNTMPAHEDLLFHLSDFDVQIAPLELGNPFAEAKSALEFLHGGIIGLPTVASPTAPFKEVINNGENGFLAYTSEDWFSILLQLQDPKLRNSVGAKAQLSCSQYHCLDAIKSILLDLLDSKISFTDDHSANIASYAPKLDTRTIYWLVGDFGFNSGGARNISVLANLANSDGFKSKILYYNSDRSVQELQRLTHLHYGFENIEIVDEFPSMEIPYAVVGTHNSSIPWLKSHAPRQTNLVYLVQDFEPFFYPMSSNYLDALSTYFDSDLKIITSLRWMSEKIFQLNGRVVPYLDFAFDRDIYNPSLFTGRSGVIFYAKEDTPRRLYELGVKTLQLVSKIDPTVPIKFYGGGKTPSTLPFVTNYGSTLSNQELASEYQKSMVGIAFGPTNPSGIPYEMMACGLPVVDVQVYGENSNKYFDDSIVLCEPNPASLAKEIFSLYCDNNYWTNRSNAGKVFVENIHSKVEIQKVLIDFLNSLRDG
jgi:glycosyltransferase involved in cell wall biosynthesis